MLQVGTDRRQLRGLNDTQGGVEERQKYSPFIVVDVILGRRRVVNYRDLAARSDGDPIHDDVGPVLHRVEQRQRWPLADGRGEIEVLDVDALDVAGDAGIDRRSAVGRRWPDVAAEDEKL